MRSFFKQLANFESLTVLLLGVFPGCSAPTTPATPATVSVEPPLVVKAIPQPAVVAPVTQPYADPIDSLRSLRSDNALPLDEYRDSLRVRIQDEEHGSLVVAWGAPVAHHFDPSTRTVFVDPRAGTISRPFFLGGNAPFDFVASVKKETIQVLAGLASLELELFEAGNKLLASWDFYQGYDEESEFVAIASGSQLGLFAGREVYRLDPIPKSIRKLNGVPILGPDEILLGRPVVCNNLLYVLVAANETTLSLRSWNPSARKVAKPWRETRPGKILDGALVCHQSEPWLLLHDVRVLIATEELGDAYVERRRDFEQGRHRGR